MAWELQVLSPTGTLLSTVTNETSPNPIDGAVKVVIDAGGRVNQLELRARQDLLQAPPRGILRYEEDGIAVGAGVIVTCPPLDSPGAGPADRDGDALERISAVGLEQLARESIVGPRLLNRAALGALGSNDVSVIAHELCRLYAHPALVVDEANFPLVGAGLSLFYEPEASLHDVLDELAGTVPGASWRVDADRAVHFSVEGGS